MAQSLLEMENELRNLQSKQQQLDRMIEQQSQLHISQSGLQRLRDQAKELQGVEEGLKTQNSSLKVQSQANSQQLKGLESAVGYLQQRLLIEKSKSQALDKQIAILNRNKQDQFPVLRPDLNQIEATANSKIQSLQHSIRQFKALLEEQSQTPKEQKKQAKGKVEQTKGKGTNESLKLQKEIGSFLKRSSEKQSQISRLKVKLKQVTAQKLRVSNSLDAHLKNQQLIKSIQTNKHLLQEIRVLRERAAKSIEQIAKCQVAQKSKNQAEKRLRQLTETFESKNKQLKQKQSQIQKLTKALKECSSKEESLKQKLRLKLQGRPSEEWAVDLLQEKQVKKKKIKKA